MSEHPNPEPTARLVASPIADLTYRTYDGPLHMRLWRWWTIAVARMRYLRMRWWFWALSALSILPWIFMALVMYLQGLAPGANTGILGKDIVGQKFAQHFMVALSGQGFWLFFIALAAGAGSIASDNRANALQVYLSKPITKGDYLLGKWMGIFVTLFSVTLVPALVFYAYCLMSYTSEGFLKDEPLLIFQLVAACAIPAAIHASLLVGFSAWSKTPLVAGVIYSGIYFCTSLISTILHHALYEGELDRGLVVQHLNVAGIMGALQQWVFGVTKHQMIVHRWRGIFREAVIPPPNVVIMLSVAAGLIILGVLAARMRIRAVEVVQG